MSAERYNILDHKGIRWSYENCLIRVRSYTHPHANATAICHDGAVEPGSVCLKPEIMFTFQFSHEHQVYRKQQWSIKPVQLRRVVLPGRKAKKKKKKEKDP